MTDDVTLSDMDVLTIIFSGMRPGRYDHDIVRKYFMEVIREEKKERESNGERLPPHVARMPGVFDGAWTSNVAYQRGIESVGFQNDYNFYSELERMAQQVKINAKIPEMDFEYLQSLGRKLEIKITENAW